jgi:hypothetical protein
VDRALHSLSLDVIVKLRAENSRQDGGTAQAKDGGAGSRELATEFLLNKATAQEVVDAYIKEQEEVDVVKSRWPNSPAEVSGARLKFDEYGNELRFPGVTVISNPEGRKYVLFEELIDGINNKQGKNKFIATVKKDSVHMTLYDLFCITDWPGKFEGQLNDETKKEIEALIKLKGLVNDEDKKGAAYWVITKKVDRALSEFQGNGKLPKFKPLQLSAFPPAQFGAASVIVLSMQPASAKDFAIVTKMQNKIKEATGIVNLGNFRAHITLGYVVNPLVGEGAKSFKNYIKYLDKKVKKGAEKSEYKLVLPSFELTYFAGMNKFATVASFSWLTPSDLYDEGLLLRSYEKQKKIEDERIASLTKEIQSRSQSSSDLKNNNAAQDLTQELTRRNRYRGLEAQLNVAKARGDLELASRISDEMLNEPLPVDSLPDMDFGSKDLAKDGGSTRAILSGIINRYKGLPLSDKLFLTDVEINAVLAAMNSKDPVVNALLAKIGDREFTKDTNGRFFAKVYPQIKGPLDEIDWRLTVNRDGGRMTVRQTVAENLRKFRENKNWRTAFDNSKGSLIIDVGSSRKKEGYIPAIFGIIDKNGRLFYVSNTPELIDMILSGGNKDLYEFNVKGDITIVDDRLIQDAFRVKSILKATFKMLDREMADSAKAKDGGTVLLEKLNAVKEKIRQNSGLEAIGVGRDQKAKLRISNADFVAFIFYPDRFNEKRVYILRQGERDYILTDDGKSEELIIGKAIDRNYPQQVALSSNVQDVYIKVLSEHLFLDITPAACNIQVLAPKNTIFSWDAKQELYTPYATNKQDGGAKVLDMQNQRAVTDLIRALYQAIENENGRLAGEIAQDLGSLGNPAAKEALEILARSENLNDAWFAHNEAQAALRHLTQVSDLERTMQDGGKEGESLEGFRKRAEELFSQEEYVKLLKLAAEIEGAFPGSELAATAKAKAEFELGAQDGGNKKADPLGGIDFRALPKMSQPMNNYLRSVFTQQPNITIGSLDEEWNSISRLVQMNTFPSNQRIKEFLWCCYQRGELNQRTTDVLVCLGEVLRLEEEEAKPTEPDVKQMLVLLEANRQS